MTSSKAFGLSVMGTSGGEELVLCPFHNDSNASAWFNPDKMVFYCAVCGFGLNAQQLIERLSLDIELDDLEEDSEPKDYQLMEDNYLFPLGEFSYHSYFAERGVHPEIAHLYRLHFRYEEPQAAVMPLTNLNADVVGVQYRYLDAIKAGTRYKTMGQVPPLWPMHFLKDYNRPDPLFVVEGAFSAMKLASYFYEMGLYRPCFALLGAKANQRIVDVLNGLPCIVLYDNDKAGIAASAKLRRFCPSGNIFNVSISPDDMDKRQLNQLMRKLHERIQ